MFTVWIITVTLRLTFFWPSRTDESSRSFVFVLLCSGRMHLSDADHCRPVRDPFYNNITPRTTPNFIFEFIFNILFNIDYFFQRPYEIILKFFIAIVFSNTTECTTQSTQIRQSALQMIRLVSQILLDIDKCYQTNGQLLYGR